MPVQHITRDRSRQGRRWEEIKSTHELKKRNWNIVEDSGSSEKFVGGVIVLKIKS